jgi:glucose-6-phosphate 1-dehydrogenase
VIHVEGSRQAGTGSLAPLRQMLIIGGTGDLSRRHLLPALTRLLANGELSGEFSLVMTGLEAMSSEACRELLARELSVHAAHAPLAARQALVERLSYREADVRDAAALRAVAVTDAVLVYLATPPEAVPAALNALASADIHQAPARFVFDKPFGLDRKSARALNARVRELVDEQHVYRIDHFLYHHMVQELVRWRVQPDSLSLIDLLPVTEAEIIWDETRAPQSTLPFYGGAIRDMIQSHLLQLTAVMTMQPPASLTRADLASSRLDALRKMTAIADPDPWLARARYIGEGDTVASGSPGSGRETLATVPLRSRMARWEHVRFLLRAAKGVSESRRHIELRFAPRSGQASLDFVRLEMLSGNLTIGVGGRQAASVEIGRSVDAESPSTRLLRAALVGDDTFTLCAEEPEEAWRIVEPVLHMWERTDAPMQTYPVGASVADIARQSVESGGA